MVIVLPMQPFMMLCDFFCVSNASMHFLSSANLIFECKIFQVISLWFGSYPVSLYQHLESWNLKALGIT